MKSILFENAEEIVRQIAAGEISSVEVTSQFLAQIKRYNIAINAITDKRDQADILEEAREKDQLMGEGKSLGLLHGLPVTVKDTFNVKGLITSNGNPRLKSNIATRDAELVRRLKEAGAIIMGKTNLALFALDWQSDNAWFGKTNNPYDLECVVGGSSGGSAASLAAGFTALELGADAGGSIRVPAHFCGVCGLRTTESALPARGNMHSPGQLRIGRYLTTTGPMARSVGDLILMLKVLSNKEQQFSENPPVDLFQYSLDANEKLNIAYSDTLGRVDLDREYKEIYLEFVEKIGQEPGMKLSNDRPQYNSDRLVDLWGKIAGFDFGVALKGIPFKKLIASTFISKKYKDKQWARAMGKGAGLSIRSYAQALEQKDDISDRFTKFFDQYDVWITPVSAGPAFNHQSPGTPFTINEKRLPYTSAFIPFNFPTTVPGHPILVIPIGQTAKGLPVGIQIHAQKWHDHKLLQIGQVLEKMTPGFRKPNMFDN
ncbi:MAG: amidase [Roseivirga sp.]|nr:amidase [Roseivirga sp.]